jgi:hypothetical protein
MRNFSFSIFNNLSLAKIILFSKPIKYSTLPSFHTARLIYFSEPGAALQCDEFPGDPQDIKMTGGCCLFLVIRIFIPGTLPAAVALLCIKANGVLF